MQGFLSSIYRTEKGFVILIHHDDSMHAGELWPMRPHIDTNRLNGLIMACRVSQALYTAERGDWLVTMTEGQLFL